MRTMRLRQEERGKLCRMTSIVRTIFRGDGKKERDGGKVDDAGE